MLCTLPQDSEDITIPLILRHPFSSLELLASHSKAEHKVATLLSEAPQQILSISPLLVDLISVILSGHRQLPQSKKVPKYLLLFHPSHSIH